MAITVRTATATDALPVTLLSRQSFLDTFAAFNTEEDMQLFMEGNFSQENLLAEFEQPEYLFLVAEENNALLGYAKLVLNATHDGMLPPPAIEIARIYAAKAAIGKGVGRALMLACLQTAKQQHYTTIWLGVWEKNERAISFYRQFGFEKFGEHPFVLGRDVQTDWLMKRTV
ncbi:MAG TPA: GNAT family N-acetyltransferase [Chitinophagaceae bacterium]|nr:GNAT family N-acetyltransferase [Chitinophagaceae bacterium]